jgi:hypothetical protein
MRLELHWAPSETEAVAAPELVVLDFVLAFVELLPQASPEAAALED